MARDRQNVRTRGCAHHDNLGARTGSEGQHVAPIALRLAHSRVLLARFNEHMAQSYAIYHPEAPPMAHPRVWSAPS